MNSLIRGWIRWLITIALAGVFIYSGVTKILDPTEFALAIANYQILPDRFVNVVALYLPWLEVLVGIVVIFPYWQKSAVFLVISMALAFILCVSSAMLRGLDISCGCFGGDSAKAGIQTLLIDVGILLGGILIIILRRRI